MGDALAASLAAKGEPKAHLDAGINELQGAIDLGGHVGRATAHAGAAVGHLKASNK